KENPQFVKELLLGLIFVICRESLQSSRDQGFRPAAIEDLILTAHGTVSLKKRFRFFDLLFMQRQKILSATALERSFAVRSVREKIFQGDKQKRTEPAFLPIDASIDLTFDQVGE